MPTFPTKPDTCQGCPAYEWGVSFVPPEGDIKSGIWFIGQGPGEVEASTQRPFHPRAPSGSMLTRWIYRASLQRTEVAITNVVWCWLPKLPPAVRNRVPIQQWGNREPTEAEARACWQRHLGPLMRDTDRFNPKRLIFPVGVPAIKWLMQLPWKRAAERQAGTLQEVELPEVTI